MIEIKYSNRPMTIMAIRSETSDMIPVERISEPEARQECDHILWANVWGDPIRASRFDNHRPLRPVGLHRFTFCPDCGTRLLPEAQNLTTPEPPRPL